MATLNFKGKPFVQNYHLTVPYHQLVPKKDKGLSDKVRLDDNLIVHGDNLKALKALLPTYAGKVKCIYIDPPYNTGNEKWVYNDSVNSPMMQEWLGKVVDREDLTRHDKWLCMMMSRLKLLRELLSPDGVIFISMDDIEVAKLRLLMDEVFGEDRFLAQFVWKSRVSEDTRAKSGISNDHEYILAYTKGEMVRFEGVEKAGEKFENPDGDRRGPWRSADMTGLATKAQRPNLHYDLINPATRVNYGCPPKGWRFNKDRMERLITEKRILWPKEKDGRPRLKLFESETRKTKNISSVILQPSTQDGTKEVNLILGDGVFSFPKPSTLIAKLISQVAGPGDIALDSFAGSGTTAHAVLALNKEDGGNRRFILVECEDYADKITAERVRRVIKGVPKASDDALRKGLGGSFSYFELGKPIEIDGILEGKNLPSYVELARYVFYTATGQDFNEKKVDEKRHFIGSSREHDVYLLYKPDVQFLKGTALTLERARALGPYKGKRRLVFAPTKYLDQDQLAELYVDFAQLPFEIYRLAE